MCKSFNFHTCNTTYVQRRIVAAVTHMQIPCRVILHVSCLGQSACSIMRAKLADLTGKPHVEFRVELTPVVPVMQLFFEKTHYTCVRRFVYF